MAPGGRAARSELIAAGELPKDWPSTYLPPRDWKGRLVASRTLELTWESEARRGRRDGRRSTQQSGDVFGWREPTLPLGRAGSPRRCRVGVAGRTASGSCSRPTRHRASPRSSPRRTTRSRSPIPWSRRPPPGAIALIGRSLNGGFSGGPDGLTFVTDRELFGTVRVRRPKALRRVVPRDILERLTPGDLVVHIDHGVARYEQMLRRGGEGDERDYLELSFAAGDRIFVPVEQIARVTRYAGGERPQLSKLGGTEWLRAKQRVRRPRSPTSPTSCSRCTPRGPAPRAMRSATTRRGRASWRRRSRTRRRIDQLRAAAEVKADMERQRPMDRLVVGDVGYGKTEVALRAAFKAMQDGKQVAVLVPTTVLAAQHHTTFSQRFAAFPLEVRLLSRFVSAKEQARDDRRARRRERSTSSSARTACCRRTCGSRTSASSWSTRSSASASRPRSGSSSSAARSTC